MKGGHRWNAGRPRTRSVASTRDRRSIDVRQLSRTGTLQAMGDHRLSWKDGGAIDLSVAADSLTLRYHYRVNGGEWQNVEQQVWLTSTPCPFGGSRAWFCCPRCPRRVAILYLDGWPACRTCKRLAYRSQSEDAIGRGWLRQWKIERRLAGGAGEWNYRNRLATTP